MKTLAKLTFVLVSVIALGSSSFANGAVPITGAFATTFQAVTPPPLMEVAVKGIGIASHLGRSTVVSLREVVDFTKPGAPITGVLIFRAANGDEIHWEMNLTSTPPVDGKVAFEGPITVISGTGRFEDATGTAWLMGTAQFTGPNSGFGELAFDGEISY